jgi:uncharacterized protein YciI
MQEFVMLFSIIGADQKDGAALRVSNAEAHRAHMILVQDQIAFAGPLQNDDGGRVIGSLLVIDFPDRQSAENWLANEPFYKAGVYASIEVRRFVNKWPQRSGYVAAA